MDLQNNASFSSYMASLLTLLQAGGGEMMGCL